MSARHARGRPPRASAPTSSRRQPASQLLLQRAIGRAEQRPGVTGAEPAVGQQVLDPRRQRHQPQRVGDRRAALADPVGDLLVGQVEVLDQLLVRGGLLERRQILAVQVLDERPLDQAEIVGVADDRRDDGQAGTPRRTPAAFAGDELVARCRRPVGPAPAAARRSRGSRRPARRATPRRSARAADVGWG